MKRTLTFLLLTAMSLAAQASSGATATPTKPAVKAKKPVATKAAPAPQPLTIPKDAVANGDGTYTWKDKQGKYWSYVKTPFGVMKNETTGPGIVTASTSLNGVKAFEDGDKVRFERPSPFGAIKWEKNKSELTDEERSLLSSQAGSTNAKQE